jgi:hypothetical protein
MHITLLSSSSWYSSLTLIIRAHSVYILSQLLTNIIQNLWYDDWMNMEDWIKSTQSGKPKYSNKNLWHSQNIHPKSHKEYVPASEWVWPSAVRGQQLSAMAMTLSEQMSMFCTRKIILCINKPLKISHNEGSIICNSYTRQKIKTQHYHYYRIL